jgi:outer membrane protein TolC
MMFLRPLIGLSLALSLLPAAPAHATTPQAADSLRLGSLHRQAEAADPRQRQFALLARQTDLRLDNLSAERLPSFRAEAQAQYQSDVFTAPAGLSFPSPSRDTYDGHVTVEQPLLDLTVGPRRGVERARLAESEATIRSALYRLRSEVNDAFFSAALLAERGRIITATITDLESRLRESRARVREGVALPGDTAAVLATLLERRQDQAEVEARRRAAVIRLAELTGTSVTGREPLALPELASSMDAARRELSSLKAHPEYQRLARARERLDRERDAVSAGRRPSISAFGRAGYGRPALNPVGDEFDAYYVVGVQLKWSPFNWGRTGREREALALQREIVTSEEDAFAAGLTRAIQSDLADVDRLDTALALDDRIVLLRDRVETEARLRFQEGVMTAAEFLDRSTDALEARLARAAHRVELVQARARFLNTLGVEIR